MRSFSNIGSIALHDFDEANWAEAARNMLIFNSYVVPITGSPFEQKEQFKIVDVIDNNKSLYYHIERPPLVFWLVSLSQRMLGVSEFSSRLPCFVIGIIGTIILFKILESLVLDKKVAWLLWLIFLCSYDWWKGMQMLTLDVPVTVFVMISLYLLLAYTERGKKKIRYLLISGVFGGMVFLDKGQVLVLLVPVLITQVLRKKLQIKDLMWWSVGVLAVVLPWLVVFVNQFGFNSFVSTYFWEMLMVHGVEQQLSQAAPTYWYWRWWIDSFRPGIFLFTLLLVKDIYLRQIKGIKIPLMVFILFGLVMYSVASNKVLWYVLPIIPAIVMYMVVAVEELLKTKKISWFGLIFTLAITSINIFLYKTNKIAFGYFGVMLLLAYLLLNIKIKNKLTEIVALGIMIVSFWNRFPVLNPSFSETRDLAIEYQKIGGNKCLWVANMPYEAVLFYFQPREIDFWSGEQKANCDNYVVSPDELPYSKVAIKERLKLYKIY